MQFIAGFHFAVHTLSGPCHRLSYYASLPHAFCHARLSSLRRLALYLPFHARFAHLRGTSTLIYYTVSRFLLVVHHLGGLLLLCGATGRLHSVDLHIHTCLPARGRDSGRDCLHADLHLVCGWQLTFLLRVCRLAQFSAFSGSLLCVSLSRVGC
jgi:hypothetical protein